mgnify:FL=1
MSSPEKSLPMLTSCVTRMLQIITMLGIFRVVKTITLISVKHLIHSNLQVTLHVSAL